MKTNYRIDITNNLQRIQDVVPSDVGSALYIEAEKVMTDSKQNYVPVVTGSLRRSGMIKLPTYNQDKIEVVAGFGSDTVDYAAVVHEAAPSVGQGRRKYLSLPLQQAIPKMAKSIAKIINSRVFSRQPKGGKKTSFTWTV